MRVPVGEKCEGGGRVGARPRHRHLKTTKRSSNGGSQRRLRAVEDFNDSAPSGIQDTIAAAAMPI